MTRKGKTIMGMAASQARFLGLTARKNNVEYEGQQINQQRTTLGNQSANYYNNLLGMSVPVPPSVQDFTKTVYTFQDGNLTNNITALIAQTNGEYKVSYVSSWQNDFTPVANGAAVIFKDTTDPNWDLYKVGNQTLRVLGTTYNAKSKEVIPDGESMESDGTQVTFLGHDISELYFSGTDSDNNEHNHLRIVQDPDDETKRIFFDDDTQQYVAFSDITVDGTIKSTGNPFSFVSISESTLVIDDLVTGVRHINGHGGKWGVSDYIKLNNVTVIPKDGVKDDNYLSTLTAEQLSKVLEQEQEYKTMLNDKYNGGDQSGEWYVRYVQNTTSGVYEPMFYNEKIVVTAQYDEDNTGASQSNIPSYKMGSAQETEEVKGVNARLEKDATGRYINITLMPEDDIELTYSLTTSTITDQDAYNDAMNQYEFDKATYDQAIQEINAKIEIVQAEDKNLELRLKQLDTEQDAISTEMDAVQKVIEKNTESTFKTFG